jgi:hypothetical protein
MNRAHESARADGVEQQCSGYGLRRALTAGVARVIAERDELNRINVFPVPDGDTGTNLAFTVSAMLNALTPRGQANAGVLAQRVAAEAIDGARGNSGAILAQFFQGVSESLGNARAMTPTALATAAGVGSQLAREALAEPREGTMLSVIAAFAQALAQAVERGARDFRGTFTHALVRAREALGETPQQLAVLRTAGVVDAGARGFVGLLEGIDEFMRHGRKARAHAVHAQLAEDGVEAPVLHGGAETHGFCTECVISAERVDRGRLKSALLALPLTSLVIAGTREKVRVHAHLDEPAALFEACERFGRVTSHKADDMRRQAEGAAQPRERVAIVADSGADLPAEEMERLNIHLVPVRISFGARDYLDKVSLSSREFFAELRDAPVPPRTSQPPPGDFRRMFEFLLSHHRQVVYVGLSRALSGTLQSAESAAARVDPARAFVIDTQHGAAAQGLLVMDAGEAALAGYDAQRLAARIEAMRARTHLFAMVRDLSYGVRGGRAPKLALPMSRWLGFVPIIRSNRRGTLSLSGVMFGRERLAERFATALMRRLRPGKQYRLLICHGDCAEDGAILRDTLRARMPNLVQHWLIEAGSGIGAHAGPGSLVVGAQEIVPLDPP